MDNISKEQIRQFCLHTHHLDTWYQKADVESVAGACGFQNSPPGAWEITLHNRIPDCKQEDLKNQGGANMSRTCANVTLQTETPAINGYVAPGFGRVREAFEENFRLRNEVGASFAGGGGSNGFADPVLGIGVSYVPNYFQYYITGDPREVALRKALYACF